MGYVAHQGALYFQWRVISGRYEAKARADAIDMGVDSHRGTAKCYGLDDVSRLAAYARQSEQVVHVAGHQTVVALHEGTGHLNQV